MLLAPCGLDVGTDPVLIDYTAIIIRMTVVKVLESLVNIFLTILISNVFQEILTIHQRTSGEVLQGSSTRVVNRNPTLVTLLGGNKDNTITGLSTVDCGRSGVLQNFN